jgi:hypothetical protein
VAQNRGYWVSGNSYGLGDVVFAPVIFDGDSPTEVFEWDEDTVPSQAFQIAYRCVRDGYTGTDAPSWPSVPGQQFSGVAVGGAQGAPDVWVSLDNRRPLRSIRLKVQFFDQITEKLRQLTLVLPLTTDR